MRRVPTWVWWTLGIAAAGGTGWLILRPSPGVTPGTGVPGNGTSPPTLPGPGGITALEPPEPPEPLPGLDGYTSFFTPESEHLVVGALESWKLENGVVKCSGVETWDEPSQKMLVDYFAEARASTLAVLDEHYPLQGTVWQAHATGQPEWAQWLFERVELLAERVVCGFEPIT